MKKSIWIFCTVLSIFILTAFGYMKGSNPLTGLTHTTPADPDLFYNVDSRFMTTITKENLHKAKSIIDILPEKATKSIESYQSVQVDIIDKASEMGDSDVLNAAQIKLLQSTDYSNNIYIRSDYKVKNTDSGELEDRYLTYFITVIPEKEAEFTSGHDGLIEYLKENSKEETAIIKQDKLQPGKVSFTVTKKGTIENVELTATSGYPSVDKALVELITTLPENWVPATNSKGTKVDQELVFFFGLEGC